MSVLAQGQSWPPVPQLLLRQLRPPGGSGVGSPLQIGVWSEWDLFGVFGGQKEEGGVGSGPGSARTILLVHIISARPFTQPLIVRTFLKVYMELGS